jgi:hypothetical protein
MEQFLNLDAVASDERLRAIARAMGAHFKEGRIVKSLSGIPMTALEATIRLALWARNTLLD